MTTEVHSPLAYSKEFVMSVTTPVSAPEMETWEMQVPGRMRIERTVVNRNNTTSRESLILGPNRIGQRFTISTDDRREHQERVADKAHDPFRNGMLLRVDKPQQEDPEIASPHAMSTEDALAILDLDEAAFGVKLEEMNEIGVRKLLELAESAGCSYQRVTQIQEHIQDKYRPGGPQKSVLGDDGPGERIS